MDRQHPTGIGNSIMNDLWEDDMFAPKFRRTGLRHMLKLLAATALTTSFATATLAQEVVSGPGAEPECFAPWTADTKYFKFPKKEGPYRIALANGFIGNTWRIQMIKTAKAYASQPEVAAKLKEFKVVSTGEEISVALPAPGSVAWSKVHEAFKGNAEAADAARASLQAALAHGGFEERARRCVRHAGRRLVALRRGGAARRRRGPRGHHEDRGPSST